MRIFYAYDGKELVANLSALPVVIGRRDMGATVDLDLTPDQNVSCPHARIWEEDGQYWIADSNSEHGTTVNDEEIKAKGPRRLGPGDVIRIGETILRLDVQTDQADSAADPDLAQVEHLATSLSASEPAFVTSDLTPSAIEQRLALFYELPLQFAAEQEPEALLQLILERTVRAIPGAKRAALLVKDQSTERLALKAHLPMGKAVMSTTLAELSMKQQRALVWPPSAPSSDPVPVSVNQHRIMSAMYAPLLWNGKVFGVVCVDNYESDQAFDADDLRLILAVAHHAAMAIANHQLQVELRSEAKALAKLVKLVPSKAEEILRQRGRARLGGDFRDATILFSDIRGFARLSAKMGPDEVIDMLIEYFSELVPIVLRHDGEIDKFVGDAILAVFGSSGDDQQQIHAIQAALEMQTAVEHVSQRRAAQGKTTAHLGIGIHCGEVVQGFTGAQERMEYTVIGDCVNRASRFCDGASKGEVLISSDVYQWVFRQIEVEQTTIPTKHEGMLTAYRVLSLRKARDQ